MSPRTAKNGGTRRTTSSRMGGTATSDGDARSRERPADQTLYPTKNSLPEETRVQAVSLLNQRLAEAIDLQTQCKQAHWNVKGPSFIGLHKLFDEIYEAAGEYIDLIAERVRE